MFPPLAYKVNAHQCFFFRVRGQKGRTVSGGEEVEGKKKRERRGEMRRWVQKYKGGEREYERKEKRDGGRKVWNGRRGKSYIRGGNKQVKVVKPEGEQRSKGRRKEKKNSKILEWRNKRKVKVFQESLPCCWRSPRLICSGNPAQDCFCVHASFAEHVSCN